MTLKQLSVIKNFVCDHDTRRDISRRAKPESGTLVCVGSRGRSNSIRHYNISDLFHRSQK